MNVLVVEIDQNLIIYSLGIESRFASSYKTAYALSSFQKLSLIVSGYIKTV